MYRVENITTGAFWFSGEVVRPGEFAYLDEVPPELEACAQDDQPPIRIVEVDDTTLEPVEAEAPAPPPAEPSAPAAPPPPKPAETKTSPPRSGGSRKKEAPSASE